MDEKSRTTNLGAAVSLAAECNCCSGPLVGSPAEGGQLLGATAAAVVNYQRRDCLVAGAFVSGGSVDAACSLRGLADATSFSTGLCSIR